MVNSQGFSKARRGEHFSPWQEDWFGHQVTWRPGGVDIDFRARLSYTIKGESTLVPGIVIRSQQGRG